MSDRILGSNLLSEPLAHQPLPADEVVAGSPTTAVVELGELDGPVEVGIWEMTEGVATDAEVDEIFIVLSGTGTVEFADGSRVELAPGVVVRLHAGERTTWTITTPLRKVYIAA